MSNSGDRLHMGQAGDFAEEGLGLFVRCGLRILRAPHPQSRHTFGWSNGFSRKDSSRRDIFADHWFHQLTFTLCT